MIVSQDMNERHEHQHVLERDHIGRHRTTKTIPRPIQTTRTNEPTTPTQADHNLQIQGQQQQRLR